MKQFNLNEYLEDSSKKIITRDGRNVRIICMNKISNDIYPITGLITCKDKKGNTFESIDTYTIDGESSKGNALETDLFFAPEKKEGWISLYKTPSGMIVPSDYVDSSKDLARLRKSPNGHTNLTFVDTIKIEWEE